MHACEGVLHQSLHIEHWTNYTSSPRISRKSSPIRCRSAMYMTAKYDNIPVNTEIANRTASGQAPGVTTARRAP